MTNIAKGIFIIPIENLHNKLTPGREKVLTMQKPVRILKKTKQKQNVNPRSILVEVTKFHYIWMSY